MIEFLLMQPISLYVSLFGLCVSLGIFVILFLRLLYDKSNVNLEKKSEIMLKVKKIKNDLSILERDANLCLRDSKKMKIGNDVEERINFLIKECIGKREILDGTYKAINEMSAHEDISKFENELRSVKEVELDMDYIKKTMMEIKKKCTGF